MRRFYLALVAAAAIGLLVADYAEGIGGRGGGGAAHRGGGGGGARPSMGAQRAPQRAPQRPAQRPGGQAHAGKQRPQTNRPGGQANAGKQRPQTNRPGGAGARPNVAQNRPGAGGTKPGMVPQNRPNVAQNRPNHPTTMPANRPGAGANRPNVAQNRPGAGGAGTRPGLVPGNNTKPGGGGIAANRPGAGGGGTQRPGIADNRPGPGGGINRPGMGGGIADNRPGPGGGINRPGIDNRPGPGGGINRPGIDNRPGPGGAINRPGIDNRPGPGAINRPGIDNRPGPGGAINRPGIDNRPGPGGGINRPGIGAGIGAGVGAGIGAGLAGDRPRPGGIGNNTAIGSGNTAVNRPEINVNNVQANNVRNVSNTFAQSNRAAVGVNNPYGGGYGGRYGYGGAGNWNGYYGGAAWNNGWYGGSWGGGYFNRPVGWIPTAAPLGWLAGASAASFAYSNPYYAAPVASTTVIEQPVYNYSQPIATPPIEVSAPVDVPLTVNVTVPESTTTTAAPPAATTPAAPAVDQQTQDVVNKDFTAAREAFMKGDYPTAQTNAEKAIKAFPKDPSLHEFLGLTLFAQAKFKDSAGVVYAVLAAQPGWSFETMIALYPDTETYTRHLRALESYQKENATRGDACFLLAYHYLTLEYKDAAIEMLRQAVKNEPKDTLSGALLKALTEPPAEATSGEVPK